MTPSFLKHLLNRAIKGVIANRANYSPDIHNFTRSRKLPLDSVVTLLHTIELLREKEIAVVSSNEKIITDTQSALDLVMTVKYETGTNKIIMEKQNIADEFFVLSSGMAGEILQKFINYHIKIAIYGDYSKYTSKPLKDFIYESNKGKDVFFVSTLDEAVDMLTR